MALIADDRHNADEDAREALAALDRLLSAAPPATPIPAREVAALVRLVRRALTNES